MLKQSLKKLEEAGFKGEMITKEIPTQANFTLFNYSLVSESFSTLQLLSNQDKDINFDKIILRNLLVHPGLKGRCSDFQLEVFYST